MVFKRLFMRTPMFCTFLSTFMPMENFIQEETKGIWIIAVLDLVLEGTDTWPFLFVKWQSFSHLFRNINIPWPSQGMGDGDYMYAFQQVVMPIASEFDPDLVIGEKCAKNPFKRVCIDGYGSCIRIWCRRRWRARRLLCYTRLLCAHDSYAYDPCERQSSRLSRGMADLRITHKFASHLQETGRV